MSVRHEPLIEYVTSLPSHDIQTLLGILEVAKKALVLDCNEAKIYSGLTLALWKSVKLEEMS